MCEYITGSDPTFCLKVVFQRVGNRGLGICEIGRSLATIGLLESGERVTALVSNLELEQLERTYDISRI